MDKIQIYETVLICLWFVAVFIQVGISIATKETGVIIGKLIGIVLSILASLPIVGRIYGWW